MKLFSYWIPTAFASSIDDVSVTVLNHFAIDTVLLDIDNTIIDPFEDELPAKVINLLHTWKASGIKIIITSNSNQKRVHYIADQVAAPYLYHTHKPLINRFKKYAKTHQIDLTHAMVVGDQLLTDAWFAKLLGLPAIVVEPFVSRDLIKTRLNRLIDRLMRRHFRKSGRYVTISEVLTREVKSHE